MDPLQRKECIDADFKVLDDGPSGSFSGYASVFGNTDRQNEVVLPGAFARTLPAFLKDGFGALNHEWSTLPIATFTAAREDSRGLYVEGQFHSTPDAQAARTIVRERLERGKSVGLSIGYKVKDDEFKDGARFLKELDLFEVSLVSVPANAEAQIVGIKADEPAITVTYSGSTTAQPINQSFTVAGNVPGISVINVDLNGKINIKADEPPQVDADLERRRAELRRLSLKHLARRARFRRH